MNSFYGGKQGRTYNIVQHFKSVYSMASSFSQGAQYSKVNYGQYVIIDTESKNNPQNGLLYRRGLNAGEGLSSTINYNDETITKDDIQQYFEHPGGGAIYVGQVVGPQGETPQITVVAFNPNSTTYVAGLPTIASTTEDSNKIKVDSKTVTDDFQNVTGAELSFQFPAPHFNVSLNSTNTYAEPALQMETPSTATPYWNTLNATIPTGKHGQDVIALEIEDIESDEHIDPEDEDSPLRIDQYLMSTFTNYDNPQQYTFASTIGPYKIIDNITSQNKERNYFTEDDWTEISSANIGDLYKFSDTEFAICTLAGSIDSQIKPQKNYNPTSTVFESGYKTVSGETIWRNQNLASTSAIASLDIDYTYGPNDVFSTRLIDNIFLDYNNNLYVSYSDESQPKYISTLEYPREYHIQGQYKLASLIEDKNTALTLASTEDDFIWIGEGFQNAEKFEYDSEWSQGSSINMRFEIGWLVSIINNNTYSFYAYDYSAAAIQTPHTITVSGSNYDSYWVQIGSIGANAIEPKCVVNINNLNNLNNYGINFLAVSGHHGGS